MAKTVAMPGSVPKGSLTSPLAVNKRRGQKSQTANSDPKQGGLPKPIR